MKNIVVSIPNTLLSGGLCLYLKKDPGFRVFQENRLEQLAATCVAADADVLLADARHHHPHTIEDWLKRSRELKENLPKCKFAFVVDENALPEVAEEVRRAKREGLIDAFFYGTVSGEYVTAVIGSL